MSETSSSLPARGLALLIGNILGWGLAWPMIKIGLNEIPVWAYRGMMLPAAAACMFALARLSGERLTLPNGQWRPLIVSALLNIFGWTAFSTWGLSLMGSGHAAIIAYTMPLWAVVFSIVFVGERPTLRRLTGLALGLAGLGILVSGEFGVMATAPFGTLLMLIAAISWGAGTVHHKHVAWRQPPLVLVGWMILIGAVPIAAVALMGDIWQLQPISPAAAWATVFVLLISTVFCWYAWFTVVKLVPVVVSTVAIMMVPIVAVVSAALILDEPFGAREAASLALVVAALALVLAPERGASAPRTKEETA